MKGVFVLVTLISNSVVTLDPIDPTNKNYFDVILDRVECVVESPETGKWHLKARKVNKTRAIFGHITFEYPIGNEIEIDVKILKKQGGEYRYLPYRIPRQPFCKFYADDKYFYKVFSKNSTVAQDMIKDCPLQPGNYTFYGAAAKSYDVPKITMQTGEYAFEWIFNKNEKIVGIYRICAFVNNV